MIAGLPSIKGAPPVLILYEPDLKDHVATVGCRLGELFIRNCSWVAYQCAEL
jgi:hypothetical protein